MRNVAGGLDDGLVMTYGVNIWIGVGFGDA